MREIPFTLRLQSADMGKENLCSGENAPDCKKKEKLVPLHLNANALSCSRAGKLSAVVWMQRSAGRKKCRFSGAAALLWWGGGGGSVLGSAAEMQSGAARKM